MKEMYFPSRIYHGKTQDIYLSQMNIWFRYVLSTPNFILIGQRVFYSLKKLLHVFEKVEHIFFFILFYSFKQEKTFYFVQQLV